MHKFGSNATYIMGLICKSSIESLKCRWKNVFSAGVALLITLSPSVLDTTHCTKDIHVTYHVHSQIKCEDKVRLDCLCQDKLIILQEASNDTFF